VDMKILAWRFQALKTQTKKHMWPEVEEGDAAAMLSPKRPPCHKDTEPHLKERETATSM
jgi:hypothetical protein